MATQSVAGVGTRQILDWGPVPREDSSLPSPPPPAVPNHTGSSSSALVCCAFCRHFERNLAPLPFPLSLLPMLWSLCIDQHLASLLPNSFIFLIFLSHPLSFFVPSLPLSLLLLPRLLSLISFHLPSSPHIPPPPPPAACQCNGHSTCVNESICEECQNNTQGANCQECADGYYGDAIGGGICTGNTSTPHSVYTHCI